MFFLFFTALLAFADKSYGPEPIPEELGKSPHSAYWAGDPEAKLKEIFKKLCEVAGYTEPIDLEYRANERLVNGNQLFVRFPDFNEDAPPKIFVGYSTFETFRNEHELAQVLGHEISHIILDHSKRKEEALKKFDILAWYTKNKRVLDRKIKEMKKRKLPSEKIQQELHTLYRKEVVFPLDRQHEEEADLEGFNLALLADFNPTSALNRVIYSVEYGWAIGACANFEECWARQPLTHDSFAQRHDRLKQILKDLKIIEE